MTVCRRTRALTVAVALGLSLAAAPDSPTLDAERYWPQWRGPHMTGVSTTAIPPVEWSESKHIRWKLPIPGRGSASPVVWGDRVFLLSAVSESGATAPGVLHKFVVMAVDRNTGDVVWERTAREDAPHEGTHRENGTYASSSAVTDGEHVIASFESRGLYAYDMDGTLVWQKDLGDKRMRNEFGEGTTPALFGHHLVVVWDHQGQSFIVALDKRTGEELWRRDRDEIDSWFTPLIVEVNGRPQVVTGAMNRIRSYDLETGDVVWHTAGLTMNPIPSPVAADGLVVLMSGYRGNSLKAIRLNDARGDITGTSAIAWTYERDTPYVPSPLLYEGILYMLKSNNGILSVFDAKTGTPHYLTQRLDAVPNVFASPVGAAGRVYIPGREGSTVVLKHGPSLEVLAVNALDDGFDASPALVDGEIYLRGYKHLYCIAEK
ncbi:MAG TPA: PQQ-binding-like beta-propeller repeat protein [Vicinamibacterales bacterium]|nr:PQQ-binding-like beta-propeller repeat protein [Vicinamibacterales bacterium]